LATIHNVTDTDDDRRNTVPIVRPLVRSAKNRKTLDNIVHKCFAESKIHTKAHSEWQIMK